MIPAVADGTFAHQLGRAFLLFGAIVASAFFVTTMSFVASWGWLTPEFERSQTAVRAESIAHTALVAEENGLRDVDDFKEFNDANGHPQGDTALQQVADVIAGCVRTTDSAYRYGGEEFCVVLRETSGEDGVLFAERLRRRIEKRFGSRGASGITVSAGVAGFTTEMPTPRALVEAADAAMYESKHAGKNRVTLRLPSALSAESPSGKIVPTLS